jgi:DNA-binding transcriptional LysR family regulator
MLDLRRLGHLVALADERHFARAAAQVHLSQPAFSRSIQALESELGQRLFDRDSGDIRPTAAGAFLIERARSLLFDARCLQRDAELFALSELGDASFGAGPFPAATLLPEVLFVMRQRHPHLRLRVDIGAWARLLEQLRAERIEFFVADVRSMPLDATLDIVSVGRQHGGFFVRPRHPLLAQPCTLAQAWSYGVASIQLPAAVKAILGKLLNLPPGQEPGMALECDDLQQLHRLALSTDTVVGSSLAAVQADRPAGRLQLLSVKDLPALYSDMGVVSLRKRSPSATARLAMQLITEAAARLHAQPAEASAAPTARKRRPQRGTGRG